MFIPLFPLDPNKLQNYYIYSISDLYKWRYKNLGDLSHVKTEREYQLANPGFEFEYQLINVQDYNCVGESEPSPYFFQVCDCHCTISILLTGHIIFKERMADLNVKKSLISEYRTWLKRNT